MFMPDTINCVPNKSGLISWMVFIVNFAAKNIQLQKSRCK